MNKGILAVVSGFSGAGKGTLIRALTERYPNYALSVSATTRQPRPGETEGKSYFFKTKEDFERMIGEGAFIEYARYVDNYYGTPRAYVEEQMAAGRDVILEIEIQGAEKVREQFPEAVLLFITPPNAAELQNRLEGRGTEDAATICSRLRRAAEEADGMDVYDYLLVNDSLEECTERLHQVLQSEHRRTGRNLAFAREMKEQLQVFRKGDEHL